MDGKIESAADDTFEMKIPEPSDWHCEMWGCGPTGMCFYPTKGNEPNFFWRWMQFLCFGNRWVKNQTASERDSQGPGIRS